MTPATYPREWLRRAIEEGDPQDDRSPFARDRDRIIYSSAFRRLAGKSQVVQAAERGNYHNRLTHTLKVAQLGRRVAEKLRSDYSGDGPYRDGEWIAAPDPDLVEAACLAHDLGHPPFGHVGERVLNSGVDQHLKELHPDWDPEEVIAVGGYEGNAQTYRILTYLGVQRSTIAEPKRQKELTPVRIGLNLTRATLAATVKYPWLRGETRHPSKRGTKWGAYCTDFEAENASEIAFAAAGIPSEYLGRDIDGTFETQLMDWCDDVAYAVHDALDFYQSGFLPLDQLLPYRQGSGKRLTKQAGEFIARCEAERGWDKKDMLAAWNLLQDSCFINQPWAPKYSTRASTQMTASAFISRMVEGAGWAQRGTRRGHNFRYHRGAPFLYEGDFVIDRDPRLHHLKWLAVSLMKQLIHFTVIGDRRLKSQQSGHEAIVRGLLGAYIAEPDLLPEDRLEELADHEELARAAADHVSSMTEADATGFLRRITGEDAGSVTDVVP
jgi:dGTPase